MPQFDLIGFDADDTLWHNERAYQEAQDRFAEILAKYQPQGWVREKLLQTEIRNLAHFGYGIKAFVLSMIESGIELTGGQISGSDISSLIEMARAMLNAEVELLPGVRETIPSLAATHPLVLITKGDLLDQERKITRSGLESYFPQVEIVSQKNSETYERILKARGTSPGRFLMVGNSLRSDVLPILSMGGSAVYIPYPFTWEHEYAETPPAGTPGFHTLENFGSLPTLLKQLEAAGE